MKRVWRTVRRSALTWIFSALFVAGGAFIDNAAAACKIQQLAELPLHVKGNRPIIDGSINGHPVKLLADTGSDKTILLRSALRKLALHSLQLNGIKFFGVGGSSVAEYVTVDKIEIGTIKSKDLDIIVSGRIGGNESVDGYLGADFLGQADVEIDLAHGVIRLMNPVGCVGDEVVYWRGSYSVGKLIGPPGMEREFLVPVKIDDHDLMAQIDSGAETSVISGQGAQKLGLNFQQSPGTPNGQSIGIGKDNIDIRAIKFKYFSFDGEVVKNPTISVGDIFSADKEVPLGSRAPQDVTIFPDMLLGADFLLAHRVYIATSQGKAYISYTGGQAFMASTKDEPQAN